VEDKLVALGTGGGGGGEGATGVVYLIEVVLLGEVEMGASF
jgi:hypothetical protein